MDNQLLFLGIMFINFNLDFICLLLRLSLFKLHAWRNESLTLSLVVIKHLPYAIRQQAAHSRQHKQVIFEKNGSVLASDSLTHCLDSIFINVLACITLFRHLYKEVEGFEMWSIIRQVLREIDAS